MVSLALYLLCIGNVSFTWVVTLCLFVALCWFSAQQFNCWSKFFGFQIDLFIVQKETAAYTKDTVITSRDNDITAHNKDIAAFIQGFKTYLETEKLKDHHAQEIAR